VPIESSMLSDLSDKPCTGMLPEFARRWPALAHVPWFPGWGDGATSNVGSGCDSRDRIALMVGTSAAMRAVWQARRIVIPRPLWCYRVDANRVVMGGALSEGGNMIDWLRRTLRLPEDPDAAERLIQGVTPDQSGLTVLPFLAGERSPGWHGDARATFSGLNLHTGAAQIYHAGHEAIAYRFALIHAALRHEVKAAARVVASGGGILHSPAWMQMMADVLGAPVTASAVYEASSRGAAVLALEAIGAALPAAQDAPVGATFMPDAARRRAYRRAAERQYALYDLLVASGDKTPK
jgi:gluconokinase